MRDKMGQKDISNKGFTLFEFLLVSVVILIVLVVAIPLLLYAIKMARLNSFKNSAYGVLDSVEFYVANSEFLDIPVDGISLDELDLNLKNNDFDDGVVKEIGNGRLELIYMKKGNFCAKGTKENMKVTDSGCGALDTTRPEEAFLYLKNATKDSLTVVASGIDNESFISYYEFSIDGKEYTKKSNSNEYTFKDISSGNHSIRVRVTNEAELNTESKDYYFFPREVSNIICKEENSLENIQKSKNVTCTYPIRETYQYEYSEDSINWTTIGLTQNKYTFSFDQNKTLYTRVIDNNKVIAITSININNIDPVLDGAYPELLTNMIPVVYDYNKNTWVKADSRTIYWDYENKIWANAVLVRKNANTDDPKSKSRSYYLSNSAIGEEIYEEDIIGYYVWIPRYKYILFNVTGKDYGINANGLQTIAIAFEGKDSIKSTGKYDMAFVNNEWYTHPAFTNQDKEINGFWVSKFQNSAGKTSSCYISRDVNGCNNIAVNLYSLPNSHSITNISISNASLISSKMSSRGNIYGLDSNVNAHVMTNLEWGAIAYLTNSKYGSNTNLEYKVGDYKNNLNSSTTGNITGIFDMSGSLPEMVMGNYNKDAGKDSSDNSGFKNMGSVEWPKNITYYEGITSKNRILGDATGETEGWYNSVNEFVNGQYPFMIRGGNINSISSIYNYSKTTGNYKDNLTFRTVFFNE